MGLRGSIGQSTRTIASLQKLHHCLKKGTFETQSTVKQFCEFVFQSSWTVLSCVFLPPLCHRISFASISYLAAITGDGVLCDSIWLCTDVPVEPVLWYRCRSGWGVCHPQLLNSSFSSCLSPYAAVFFHCPDKRHRDGNLLQMSLIMNSVKPWFTPAWRCWGNVGRNSLI